jgi:hypothetical protein
VQHATFMRMGQRVRDLHGVIDHPVDRQARARRDDAVERLAIDQLHGEKGQAVVFADLVDRADVGMIDRGRGAGRVVIAVSRAQDFDRHVTTEFVVVGAIHVAHAAGAEQRSDPVRA